MIIYGSWIYNYLCNQCLSLLMLWVWISIRARCKTSCDKVCLWLAAGRLFSPGTLVSSTNKTDHHDITEILLKVALNTITLTLYFYKYKHFIVISLYYPQHFRMNSEILLWHLFVTLSCYSCYIFCPRWLIFWFTFIPLKVNNIQASIDANTRGKHEKWNKCQIKESETI